MPHDLPSRIHADMPRTVAELESLVRIPSVSAPGFPDSQVRRSAEAVRDLLAESGSPDARLLEVDGAHPAVFAEAAGPDGAPTVLLYAHHDVQPPGPTDDWSTPPFVPTERDGRLYGRGTSDDKCGIVTHAAVLRAFESDPPVTIKVLVEGEEEIGSRNLSRFLDEYAELLAADVIVIADSANWRVGTPALTTSLRGLVDCTIEVRTLRSAVHSGQFGGPIPDALTVLVRALATLHDDSGSVAVPGLTFDDMEPLDLTEEELRTQAGTVDGLEMIGGGSLTARLWRRPAISILAIDAPPIAEAINQLVPVARAKVSLRLAPGDDPRRAMDALSAHLSAAVPWGAEVRVEPGAMGDAFDLDSSGPAYTAFAEAMREAYGVAPVEMGIGGSIPFVASFQQRYPNAAILLTGVADPTSAAHGPNESLDLADLEHGIVAEALALQRLAHL